MSELFFKNRREIREWVRGISSLDAKQRQAVEEVLAAHLDYGGVSAQELKESVLREFRALRESGVIGEADYAALARAIAEMLSRA